MSWEELEKIKIRWQDKRFHYERELCITACSSKQFEMREKIKQCDQKIERLNKEIEIFKNTPQEIQISESASFLNSQSSCSILTEEEYRYRKGLLANVKRTWIKNVLKDSLHNKVFVKLGWKEKPDLVNDSFCNLKTKSLEHNFAEGNNIIDVFKELEIERTLLILGDPGSGKTITLLKIAESLITNINNISLEIPVVFNLSSWVNTRQDITNWLIQELTRRYKIRKYLAKKWIQEESLILLLDGLDEVKDGFRETCIEAINKFRDEHGATKVVICSRIDDYKNISLHLELETAIYIKPLSSEQINWYLDNAKDQLEGLIILLKNNPSLQKLAQSPLMLSIMILAYEGLTIDQIPQLQSEKEKRVEDLEKKWEKNLFNCYIERMLQGLRSKSYIKLSLEQYYLPKQSISWLTWLAQKMIKESQKVFFIEEIQPYYLSNTFQKCLYRISLLTTIIFYFYIAHLFVYYFILDAVFFITKQHQAIGTKNFYDNLFGITRLGFIIGLVIIGLSIILEKFFNKKELVIAAPEIGLWSKKKGVEAFLKSRNIGYSFGTISNIISSIIFLLLLSVDLFFKTDLLSNEKPIELMFTNYGIIESFFIIIAVGITCLLIEKLLISLKIIPSEIHKTNFRFINIFSNKISWKYIIFSLGLLCISPLIHKFLLDILLSFLLYYFTSGLVSISFFSVVFGVLGSIFGGWTRSKIQKTIYPNQGIRVLAIKTIILYSITSLSIGLIVGTITHFKTGNPLGINDMKSDGLSYGLYYGLYYGTILSLIFGIACIKHFALRLILYRKKNMPWNYSHFLDYATDRGILQKVDGGYQFVHRKLMEYFANLNGCSTKHHRLSSTDKR